jgi:hypothetical protein
MGKTHGSNFVPEPIPDGSDIRRISEPASKIAIPTHIEQSRILSSLFQEEEIHMLALCRGQVFNNTKTNTIRRGQVVKQCHPLEQEQTPTYLGQKLLYQVLTLKE